MPDIIKLLPDAVANQIAAGEVIQRPASVIKELVENSIDAGAKNVTILVKEAGRASIQIIDDGVGMSETDARMAFERHATSKISCAEDLFALQSKGFRGEALASIAAVAQVELKTCKHGEELGTRIQISGSKVDVQETISCAPGTSFTVNNLFFNIPARRKFLKANTTEFRHIVNEFTRIALVEPDVRMVLKHNNEIVYDLPAGNIKTRIVNLMGNAIGSRLFDIKVDTPIVTLHGFIGKPEFARKRSGDQFFFANNRYMRHPYFHRAIMEAYSNLLPQETVPSYFIFFDVKPDELDVNIHPTKTEIKFENEQAIWPILLATVKETLGKFNVVPSIDFDQEGSVDIPVINRDTVFKMPTVQVNPAFNPFKSSQGFNSGSSNAKGWEDFYSAKKPVEQQQTLELSSRLNPAQTSDANLNYKDEVAQTEQFFQLKNRFILTSVKSGLMLIDQRRAHIRVLYEKYLLHLEQRKGISQKLLFPETLELSFDDQQVLADIKDELYALGFDISVVPDGVSEIRGVPGDLLKTDPHVLVQKLISVAKSDKEMMRNVLHEKLAASIAEFSAIGYGNKLSIQEMQEVVGMLFACKMPSYTPDGKIVVSILSNEDLIRRFS